MSTNPNLLLFKELKLGLRMIKSLLFIVLSFFCLKIQAQQSDFNTINFEKADAVANKYKGESLESLPILSYNLTNTLATDVEKFRAISYLKIHKH